MFPICKDILDLLLVISGICLTSSHWIENLHIYSIAHLKFASMIVVFSLRI